jgi:DNA-binding NarL/FixJ family response regulator
LGMVGVWALGQCGLMPIRLLIVDDHDLVRESLGAALDGQREIEVVGCAGDGYEALETAVAVRPDVVLMDLMMPRLDGIATTRMLRRLCPDSRVVVLTATTAGRAHQRAAAAGATSVVAKNADLAAVVEAIVAAATPRPQVY